MTLTLALLLDAILGEPKALWRRLPHPAVLMGRAVSWLDAKLNDKSRGAGILAVLMLVSGAIVVGGVVSALPFAHVFEVILAAILLAHRSLVDHVYDVAKALRVSLENGRDAVAQIVGRDVRALNESGVARGAIESAAENMSDGVIAPAFWFVVLGLPGMLAYKAINTADSMIGYRTEKYANFGWAAARLDDLVNWIPARLTALLILISSGRFDLWALLRRDAGLHRSPNAGWPETAMAGVLGVALSGPRSYHGQMRDEPYVNPEGLREIGAAEIEACTWVLWRAWLAVLALSFAGVLLL